MPLLDHGTANKRKLAQGRDFRAANGLGDPNPHGDEHPYRYHHRTLTLTAPRNSVYPITINAGLLDAHGFVPPWQHGAAELHHRIHRHSDRRRHGHAKLCQPYRAAFS